MRKLAPVTQQVQAFVEEVKESFWGDLYGKTKLVDLRVCGCRRSHPVDGIVTLRCEHGRSRALRPSRHGLSRRVPLRELHSR
jgi:hypothetical protein